MTVPELSVIVLGHRNESTLVDAVDSVAGEAVEHGVELVVVTSGPRSGESRVRERHPGVRVVHSPAGLLPGAARNAGVAATAGRCVAFLEGDCLARPGWIAGRLAAHEAGHVAVASSVGLAGRRTPWATASWLLSYRNRTPGWPEGPVDASDPRAHGLSIRRDVLTRTGGFVEHLRIAEDTLMAHRLARAGHPIWFVPSVTTEIRSPGGPVALVVDEFRRGYRVGAAAADLAALDLPRPSPPSWTRARRSAALAGRLGRQHGGLSRSERRTARPFLFAGAVARSLGEAAARFS